MTDPQVDATYALNKLFELRPWYDELRDYEAGRQPIMFASQKFERFYEAVMRRYRLNICRPVVRQVARRLDIEGWEGDDKAAEWWTDGGKQLQNRGFREAVRQGDAYLLTWPSGTMNGPLRTNRLRADEAIVVYKDDEPDVPEFAVTMWQTQDRKSSTSDVTLRLNVYYPDVMSRWQADTATMTTLQQRVRAGQTITAALDGLTLEPYEDDDTPHEATYEGPLAEAGQDGLLPLQHLAVQPDATPYGTSVLDDVLPVQDAINKHAIDILVTSEQYGLPLRAMLGLEEIRMTEVDDDGNVVERSNLDDIQYDPRIDLMLALPGENSKLVQLPEADITRLLEVKRAALQDATIASNVPLMLLAEDSSNVPTGVALREIKAPLAELVEDISQDLTVPMRNVARLHGWDAVPHWAPAIRMDPVEQWELVGKKVEAGWPRRQAIIETGLDPEFVDEVLAEAEVAERNAGSLLMQAQREGRDPVELLRDSQVRQ
jgi:hypothetical protein